MDRPRTSGRVLTLPRFNPNAQAESDRELFRRYTRLRQEERRRQLRAVARRQLALGAALGFALGAALVRFWP